MKILLVLFTVWIAKTFVATQDIQKPLNECLELTLEDYDKNESPKGDDDSAIKIRVTFDLLDLDEINEEDMDIRLHGYLHMLWRDNRLNNSSPVPLISTRCKNAIWRPNVVFETAKHTNTFGNDVTMVRTGPNNTMVYVQDRYSFKVGCYMQFHNYPFDTQNCRFSIGLMANNDKYVRLLWGMSEDREPVLVDKPIHPLQYYFTRHRATTHIKTYGFTNMTFLDLDLRLVRRLTGSIINVFIPSSLIVAVSGLTFWLRVEAAPARVSLSITSLLTLCTQVRQTKSLLPPLSYITGVDIWIFVCIFMVFFTLVEFAIAYNGYADTKIRLFRNSGKQDPETGTKKPPISAKSRLCIITASDAVCRVAYPIIFACFTIIYWGYFLHIRALSM